MPSKTYYGSYGVARITIQSCSYEFRPNKCYVPEEKFGDVNRRLPVLTTSCEHCQAFLDSPQGQLDWSSTPQAATLNGDEHRFVEGGLLRGQIALDGVLDTLKAIRAQQQSERR